MRNLMILFIFGAFLLPIGCTSDDPFRKVTVPEAGPTGLDEAQFDDVPVPKGFRLWTRRSFSYRSGDLRMGQFVYRGVRLSPSGVLRWYEREMARSIHGWTLADLRVEDGWVLFRKGRDEAKVRADVAGDQTRVTVDVNYREDAPRKKS